MDALDTLDSRPLLVVDGDNLAHRAYHSVPKTVLGTTGRPVNAIVGWTTMLIFVWEKVQPRAVYVAWDTLGVPTYRNHLWPPYQTGRVFDDAIVEQLDLLPELARAFGFGVGKEPGYEADDLVAGAVAAESARGGTSVILTNDRDAYQLVSDSVAVLSPRKSISDLVAIGADEVMERMGVPPALVPDYKALAGDASDVIPGARGIGPKGAAALLKRHGSLEAVLATRSDWASGTPDGDRLRCFHEVVTMRPPAPSIINLPATGPPDWAVAAAGLRTLGAVTMAERVAARARAADADV